MSSPLTQELTFLSSFEKLEGISASYNLPRAWFFGPRSGRTQHFSICSKTYFLHILTTVKSESALQLIVCHNANWQQFFLVANKIMMHLVISGISDAIKHSQIIVSHTGLA